MLFRVLGNRLSPAGERGRLVVLIYHRVLPAADPILQGAIDAQGFERHMALLADEFNVLPLGDACKRLARGTLPARAVSITFDDGYADNEEVALPILKRFALGATFFVATGFSSGGVMFNDRIIEAVRHAAPGHHDLSRLSLGALELEGSESRARAVDSLVSAVMHRPYAEREALVEELADSLRAPLPGKLMMTPAQIQSLHRAGMEIGAHTVRHPILMSIPDHEARAEIVESKRTLEEITGSPVTLFAYPNGKPDRDYGVQHVRFAKEAGFAAAVSTIAGVAHRGSDLFQLPRLGPWERNTNRLAIRLLASCARAVPA
jgi:peptidoglycan/xylan/chitin deacetylase (PgdA/CDA1 family)